MKVTYKPLDELNHLDTKKSKKSSNFNGMLDKHLEQTRSQSLVVDASRVGGNTKDNRNLDLSANLDSLKNLDPEYHAKGSKKLTLAENFSKNHDAKLETRIEKYQHLIEEKAKKYHLDPTLLAGLIRQESNFNPYAVSHCGAMGLGQIMPETARYLGVKDPFNAAQNLDGAAKYLREQLDTFGGNVDKALAAYNAGPGAVQKYGGIPPYKETQNYVKAIRSHRVQIAGLNVFKKEDV
jgi:soluble lytic murein transglycosylase-like protein